MGSPDGSSEGALQRATSGRRRSLLGPAERPGHMVSLVLVAAFFAEMFIGGPERWGLSAQALARGRYETLITHMLSHAGVFHLLMNLGALSTLSAVVTRHTGFRLRDWWRYGLLLMLSGLAGALTYLAIHPFGTVPMVGISGAVCGLWGAALRLPFEPGAALFPLRSPRVVGGARQFAISNAILFAALFALVLLTGGVGGLAWEAHLGGFVFGLLAVPLFLPRRPLATAGPWS